MITEEKYTQAQTEKQALEQMLETKGWQLLKEHLRAMIRVRRATVFQSVISDLGDCFRDAAAKAEAAGLQFALATPEVLIEDCEADIARFLEQERESSEEKEKD